MIKIKNFSSIKQTSRRIPLQMREKVNKIIKEIKDQDIIEKSISPWISPTGDLSKKEGWMDKILCGLPQSKCSNNERFLPEFYHYLE